MKKVNRRELNQRSGQIVDEVLATGEPIEVVTRDRGSVIISKKPESTYERWVREGLVIPAKSSLRFDEPLPEVDSRSIEEILGDMEEDH
jgi:hypothetical protein